MSNMENKGSYHIFYYTFLWHNILQDEKECKKENVWKKLNRFTSNGKWIRRSELVRQEYENNIPSHFDEMCYFYEYTHQILFDKNKYTHVLHFEREEFEQNNQQIRYIIETNKKKYNLKIDRINLDLYELGVGILSFHIENDMEHFDIEDVCNINSYGRCVYVPFWEDQISHSQIPNKISITGLGEEYSHEYNLNKENSKELLLPWHLPDHLYKLLMSDLFNKYSGISVHPAIDNRMFVNCWYCDDVLSKELSSIDLKSDKKTQILKWKALYGIDSPSSMQTDEIDNEEICRHTYSLWQRYGTLYGYTRYSFILLTNAESYSQKMKTHLQTMYSRILKLVLLQKSSILHFSKDISAISLNQDNEEYLIKVVQRIYNQYITFTNHIYFNDITPQPQGTEIYNRLQNELEIADNVSKLNQSIGDVYNSLSATMYASKRDRQSRALNWIAVLFLPPSLVTSFCGMSQLWYNKFTFDLFIAECLWSVGITIVLAFIFWFITKSSDKKKKRRPFS